MSCEGIHMVIDNTKLYAYCMRKELILHALIEQI